jgi:hypothetical protein
MKKIFWSYSVTIFIIFSALITLLQMKEFQRIDLTFSILLSTILAIVGGGLGAIVVSLVRKKDEEIKQYQIPNEPETKGIFKFVFLGEKLQFKNTVPLETAVERLKHDIIEIPFPFLSRSFRGNGVIGKVSVNRVKLVYVTADMRRNSFNPIFIGKFQQDGSGSVLSGVYRLHRFITALTCIWFCGLAIGSTIAMTILIVDSKSHSLATPVWIIALLFIVFPLLMGAGGLGLVTFGKRVARANMQHLTEAIEKSMGMPRP